MAKKKDYKNKEEIKEFEVTNCDLQKDAPVEVVAKCNHPEEVIANCDHLQSLKFRPTLPFAWLPADQDVVDLLLQQTF